MSNCNMVTEKFDVVVIGGGPAGMMAAGRSAELGARTVLLEKNSSLEKKLLITGKGRCNITQAEYDDKQIVKKIGKNGKFIFSSLSAFGPKDVMNFFETRNLPVKIERGGRVFPVVDKSYDVLDVLVRYLKENKVMIMCGEEVLGFGLENGKVEYVKTKKISGSRAINKIYARSFIVCTGGKSYPATGSTGDGYKWVKKLGHRIISPVPALVPIKIRESWIKNMQGLSLKNVRINIFQNGKKQDSRFGEMIFTHFGISGPIVIDASKTVGKLLIDGKVSISIDLKPALDFPAFDKRLQRDFEQNASKDFKNYLPDLLPQKIISTVISISGINQKKKVGLITKEERKKLVNLLKDLRLTVAGLMGFDQAIVTSGGVELKEVDSKTMRSKIIDNLFLAGEVLDLDGPTGGYNLQICWSTGYAAGAHAYIAKK